MKGYLAAGLDDAIFSKSHEKVAERVSQYYALSKLRQIYHSGIDSDGFHFCGSSLAVILRHTKEFHVTDPRDKIYGCIGLLSMSERETIKPDYQKPIELVFLEATKHLLEHSDSDFFSFFSLSTSRKSFSRASPSWVPDFSAQKTLSPCDPDVMTCLPGSNKPISRNITKCVSFRGHNRVLVITGVLFDTIEVSCRAE